ncbi:MAG: alpha/beta fold hydrolase [Actinomycetota bacterium]|nr:alpha/beta fold hydrolase [Actinomycetota bacterium]
MAFVVANGVRLHVQRVPEYDRTATRPIVVLLHGLGDSMASFYFTLTGPLADAGFDVISYDHRGHGRSETPSTGYTVTDAGDDLDGLLTSLEVDTPVHLVGYSYGGTIAFGFAHRHPDRVASIALIEAEPPTKNWAVRMVDGLRRAGVHMEDDEYLAGQPEILRRAAAKGRELAAHTTVQQDLTAPAGLMDAARLPLVGQPKLLILGSDSELCGVRSELAPLLTRCQTEIIDGADHLLLARAPNAVRELLLPWLEKRALR